MEQSGGVRCLNLGFYTISSFFKYIAYLNSLGTQNPSRTTSYDCASSYQKICGIVNGATKISSHFDGDSMSEHEWPGLLVVDHLSAKTGRAHQGTDVLGNPSLPGQRQMP